jgi:Tol biopolymer transport system component
MRKLRRDRRGLGMLAAAVLVSAVCATGASATSPGLNGRIVFTAVVGKHTQLFTVRADGSGQTQITHLQDGTDALNANWSPDGNRIAFERDYPYPHAAVFTMNADGGQLRTLTPKKKLFFEGAPAWSPDGKRIVLARQVCFTSACTGPRDHNELWIMNRNGSGARQVTRPLVTGAHAENFVDHPQFSPDGRRIVYVKRLGGKAAVFVVNVHGSGVRQLTNFQMGVDDRVDWSPDGSRILFSDNEKFVDIYTVHPDGKALTQLTHSEGGNYSAKSWSPDGKQILLVRGRPGGSRSLYVMNTDGGALTQLTKDLLVKGGSWGTHP